jgi:bifunctional enzyme CysN/CysC
MDGPRSRASPWQAPGGSQGPASPFGLLQQRAEKDLLRFSICGSTGVGKSALVACLLRESQALLKKHPQAEPSEYNAPQDAGAAAAALSPGGQRAEGGDAGRCRFSFPGRDFIAIEASGCEPFAPAPAVGSTHPQVALLLVDAQQGLLAATRRQAYLLSLTGTRHVVLVVSKMDQVGFAASAFMAIQEEFEGYAGALGFDVVASIPVCALHGDNIGQRSPHTDWYEGPVLAECLESAPLGPVRPDSVRFVFSVQGGERIKDEPPCLRGSVAQGQVREGDTVRVTASGLTAVVQRIAIPGGLRVQAAREGDTAILTLSEEVEAQNGDVLSLSQHPLEVTDQFEAHLIWLHEQTGLVGRSYEIRLAGQVASASLTAIKHRVNVDTMAHEACSTLGLHDVAACNLAVNKPLVFDSYINSPFLGRFILVDRHAHATVAIGIVRHGLRRAQNLHHQALSITCADRERLNGHPGRVVWFTGLSGSGKSTLANALEVALHAQGRRTYILDGDNVRLGLNKDLGFTDADRVENIRRVAEVAKLMMDAGLVVITAFISPFRQEREMARELIGAANFVEVHVSTPLQVCEQRDVKGLYKKARAGLLPNMTGVHSPYEAPEKPDFLADGSLRSVSDIVNDIIKIC